MKRRVRRVPDAAERQKLLEVAEPHVRRLIIAAMYTGLREGAIMRLSAEHFAERAGWLRATDEKGSKEYWIPVPGRWRRWSARWGSSRGRSGVSRTAT